MEKTLPKWLETRYSIMWEAFGDRAFGFEDAVKVLMEKNKDKWEDISAILSELRKADWLETEADSRDARKKIYRLRSRVEAIRELLSVEKETLTRGDVEGLLKKAADLIRTRVDYKFILILLFLKRISDKWDIEFEQAFRGALKDELTERQAKVEAKSAAYHDFDLPEEFLWDNIRKDVSRLPEVFSRALKEIAQRNVELKDVVDSVDFVQFAASSENAEILRQLVELFSERKLHRVSPDILGDAYEWILRYFAPSKAKEGEIYTPREVIKLIVEVLDPKPEESVYDPACGSGGMLISAFKHVEKNYGRNGARKLFLFGQEVNQRTIALAKMNMYIHDIRDCNLAFGDTFLYPKFKEGEVLKTFDVVVANPPWNQDGYDEEVLKRGEYWKQRFTYGFGPRQSADWAWIQHMLASAKDDGSRVGIVIDNGCLFRGGKEKAVRAAVLNGKNDLVECVVLLPAKLFYNTGAPGAIIIFNKHKSADRKRKVLFVNASREFGQHPEVRKLNRLGDDNIERIAKAYKSFSEEKGFSRIVSLKDIEDNDYNLNVTLYVMPGEEGEHVDVPQEFSELMELDKQQLEATDKLKPRISDLIEALEGKEYKDTPIGKIPKQWELKTLLDAVGKKKDLIIAGPFGSNLKVSDYRDEGIPIIRLQNIEYGRFINKDIKYISPEKAEELSYHSFVRGDIVLAKLGDPIGKTCIVPDFLEKGIVVADVVRIRIDEHLLNKKYAMYILNSPYISNQLNRETIGTTRPRVNLDQVRNLLVPIPSLSEQKQIADTLSTVDLKLELERNEKDKLEKIKRGLLDLLRTGKPKVRAD